MIALRIVCRKWPLEYAAKARDRSSLRFVGWHNACILKSEGRSEEPTVTPDQIDQVEATFAKLSPVTNSLGMAFYDRLFEIDPTARPLFHHSMEAQAIKLMQVLSFAVSNLREPETLLPIVRELGRKHVGYGVAEPQYESVANALMHTLKISLGDAWTSQVEEAWLAAYATIAREIKNAARSA